MIKKLKDCTEQELKDLTIKAQSHLYNNACLSACEKVDNYWRFCLSNCEIGSSMDVHEDVEIDLSTSVLLDVKHANDLRVIEKADRIADPNKYALLEEKTAEQVGQEVLDGLYDPMPFPDYDGAPITKEQLDVYIELNSGV